MEGETLAFPYLQEAKPPPLPPPLPPPPPPAAPAPRAAALPSRKPPWPRRGALLGGGARPRALAKAPREERSWLRRANEHVHAAAVRSKMNQEVVPPIYGTRCRAGGGASCRGRCCRAGGGASMGRRRLPSCQTTRPSPECRERALAQEALPPPPSPSPPLAVALRPPSFLAARIENGARSGSELLFQLRDCGPTLAALHTHLRCRSLPLLTPPPPVRTCRA